MNYSTERGCRDEGQIKREKRAREREYQSGKVRGRGVRDSERE